MTALTHAVVDGGMASHLASSIGAIAQLAEYRIVYQATYDDFVILKNKLENGVDLCR
jgi:hypothetical protein